MEAVNDNDDHQPESDDAEEVKEAVLKRIFILRRIEYRILFVC